MWQSSKSNYKTYIKSDVHTRCINGYPLPGLPREFLGPRAKGNLAPLLQIMILTLIPPWCVISKESVQQKWIDELWFRQQLSTCLNSWAPADPPPPLSGPAHYNEWLKTHNDWTIIIKNKSYPIYNLKYIH